jgi:hypothetical protein
VDPALGRTEYRTKLLAAFFYKAFLSLFPQDTIPPRFRSSIVEVCNIKRSSDHAVFFPPLSSLLLLKSMALSP